MKTYIVSNTYESVIVLRNGYASVIPTVSKVFTTGPVITLRDWLRFLYTQVVAMVFKERNQLRSEFTENPSVISKTAWLRLVAYSLFFNEKISVINVLNPLRNHRNSPPFLKGGVTVTHWVGRVVITVGGAL